MGALEERTMFCALCGSPFFEPAMVRYHDYPPWLADAVLLDHSNGDIFESPAENRGGPFFQLKSSNETVTACEIPRIGNQYPKLRLACHANCIVIAKQAISYSHKLEGTTSSASMRHLWVFLEDVHQQMAPNLRRPILRLLIRSGYHGDLRWTGSDWDPGDDPRFIKEAKV